MTRARPTRCTLSLVALLAACATSVGPSGRGGPTGGPFDRDELALCDARTSGVGVRTIHGGRMTVRLVGTCSGPSTCDSPDELAPGAWATIRVAGREILVASCVIDAFGGTALEVAFRSDATEDEVYEIPLTGACLDVSLTGCGRDSGPPPPSDAGGSIDGGVALDAGAMPDAT